MASKSENSLISHYGLFWREADVFWGVQKRPGQLLGTPKKEEGKDYRDFKGVYALYADYELIYVGQAGIKKHKKNAGNESSRNLFDRLRSHRTGPLANRWQHFSWFGVQSLPENVNSEQALEQLEAICIALTNPGFNK